jgi:hypothetical protein
LVGVENTRPTFVQKVHNSQSHDAIEVRLCLGEAATNANVGVEFLHIETAMGGTWGGG